jgi:hypothetical protein
VEKINSGGQMSRLEKQGIPKKPLEETKFGPIYGGSMIGDFTRDAQIVTNLGLQILLKTLPDDLRNSGHCLKFSLAHDGTVYLCDPAQHRILVGKPQ